jgi:transposase
MLPQGFVVLPRRWVVEWMIAWIDQNRRMSLRITSG